VIATLVAFGRAAPAMQHGEIVPRGQDFATVGHLYRSIEAGIKHLADQATLRRLAARVQPLGPLPAIETRSEAGTDDRAAARALDLIDAAISADFNTAKLLAAFQDARIRAELDARGVQVTDTAEGPAWQLR